MGPCRGLALADVLTFYVHILIAVWFFLEVSSVSAHDHCIKWACLAILAIQALLINTKMSSELLNKYWTRREHLWSCLKDIEQHIISFQAFSSDLVGFGGALCNSVTLEFCQYCEIILLCLQIVLNLEPVIFFREIQ